MNSITSLPRLVCQPNSFGSSQWCVWEEDNPYRRACGDRPIAALQRFLQINCRGEWRFDLICDEELTGWGQSDCRMRWSPPDLYRECPECRGSGTYVGFLSREPCRECAGRGEVSVIVG